MRKQNNPPLISENYDSKELNVSNEQSDQNYTQYKTQMSKFYKKKITLHVKVFLNNLEVILGMYDLEKEKNPNFECPINLETEKKYVFKYMIAQC